MRIIEEKELVRLIEDSLKLKALEMGGVDNWVNYDYSLDNNIECSVGSITKPDGTKVDLSYNEYINKCSREDLISKYKEINKKTKKVEEKELARLIRNSLKLEALELGGVDNWTDYDNSLNDSFINIFTPNGTEVNISYRDYIDETSDESLTEGYENL